MLLLVVKEKRKQVMDTNGVMKKYKIKIKNPVMGVPISFLDKYCPTQFEIVGQLNVGCFMDNNGWQGSNSKNMLSVNGKTAYKRVLIRRR